MSTLKEALPKASHGRATLLGLPNDLLTNIVQPTLLDQTSLAFLSRTCYRISRLTRHLVFANVHLTSSKQSRILIKTLRSDSGAQLAAQIHAIHVLYTADESALSDVTRLVRHVPHLSSLSVASGSPNRVPFVHQVLRGREALGLGRRRKREPEYPSDLLPNLTSCAIDFFDSPAPWDDSESGFFLTHKQLRSLKLARMCISSINPGIPPFDWVNEFEDRRGVTKLEELILDDIHVNWRTFEYMVMPPAGLVRLHFSYQDFEHSMLVREATDGERFLEALASHRNTLEDLRIWDVKSVGPVSFLGFPRMRKLDVTVKFVGRDLLNESECFGQDWSDTVRDDVEEFTVRSRNWSYKAPKFCAIIIPREKVAEEQ